MANAPVGYPESTRALPSPRQDQKSQHGNNTEHGQRAARTFALLFLAAVVFCAPLLFAQATPRISSADPTSGKADDTVTLTGENLGKAVVTGVFLSDDKNDYKATVVDQGDSKIVVKIPKVKAGPYNFSVQVSTNIYIEPVRFTVQE